MRQLRADPGSGQIRLALLVAKGTLSSSGLGSVEKHLRGHVCEP